MVSTTPRNGRLDQGRDGHSAAPGRRSPSTSSTATASWRCRMRHQDQRPEPGDGRVARRSRRRKRSADDLTAVIAAHALRVRAGDPSRVREFELLAKANEALFAIMASSCYPPHRLGAIQPVDDRGPRQAESCLATSSASTPTPTATRVRPRRSRTFCAATKARRGRRRPIESPMTASTACAS